MLITCIIVQITACTSDDAKPGLVITSMAPLSGPKETIVTITGSGFSQTLTNNAVTLNDKLCQVTAVTATTLTVSIPAKAGSGKLVVTVGNKTGESPSFEYLLTHTVSTFAGSTSGNVDGTGTAAQFFGLFGMAIDNNDNLFVTEYINNKIRKITPSAVVTTLATGDGSLRGLAFDEDNNLFVLDDHKIFKRTPGGVVTTIAGSTSGFADGMGTAAQFAEPIGIALDAAGNLFVSDFFNHRIRKITPAGEVTTLAGGVQGFADGTGTEAQFSSPQNLIFGNEGNLFVADEGNNRIRKITPQGVVTTLAGSTQGLANGTGTAAQFYAPRSLVLDQEGNLLVADYGNSLIRKITPAGVVSTFAGSTAGYQDGLTAEAKFNMPNGLVFDKDGNLFITDLNNYRIRKIVSE